MGEHERSIEELGDEITSLAGHLNASTCRWLELVAEFDEREGWASWGCKSCAHWISWRCSVAPGAAREQVRVARRLGDLPLIRDAFAAGELSFSKVRALSRIEEVEREAELLELARTSTASQLERIVRGYRKVTNADAGRAIERRFLSVTYDDDGSVVLRGRLPHDEGAVLLKALELARDELRQTGWAEQRVCTETPPDATPDVSAETPPDATLGVSAETPPDATPDVSAETSVADATPDVAEAPAPAAPRLDDESPSWAVGGVSAETPEPAVRDVDALVLLIETALAAQADARGRSGGERFQVVVHVDTETLSGRGDTTDHSSCETDDGAPLAAETARRLCCDAALVPLLERAGETLSVGRKTRSIPPALQRALRTRDGGCRFPGCGQQRHVDAHHIEHWAHGGETKLANLVQLCRHHHRLLHEGGYSVERRPGDQLIFRRPDGRRLHAIAPPAAGSARRLREDNARCGIRVTSETSVPDWYGDRMHLGDAVEAVLHFTGAAE